MEKNQDLNKGGNNIPHLIIHAYNEKIDYMSQAFKILFFLWWFVLLVSWPCFCIVSFTISLVFDEIELIGRKIAIGFSKYF